MTTSSTRLRTIAMLLLIFVFSACSSRQGQKNTQTQKSQQNSGIEKIELFNGKDLSNWTFYLKDPSVDPNGVFTVKDGVIHITGDPFGYMRTKEQYSDFVLHVEYRWPQEATNSGIFIYAMPPDTTWLKCFECQLAAGKAGDLICMNGTDMNERTDKSKIVVNKLAPSAEKAVGEWNTVEITGRGNTLEVIINGVMMNKATGTSVSKGHICLQSEGKDIEFRNVYLTPLENQGIR